MALDTDVQRALIRNDEHDLISAQARILDLCDEVDRLRAALADIADGECAAMSGTCAPDDRCDVCTARAALEGQEVAP